MKLIIKIFVVFFLAVPCSYGKTLGVSFGNLNLSRVYLTEKISFELPINWRYRQTLVYDEEPIVSLKEYLDAGGDGDHKILQLQLRDANGKDVAFIFTDDRELLALWDGDMDWRHPERLITQEQVNRAGDVWVEKFFKDIYSPYGRLCSDQEMVVEKRRIHGLSAIVYSGYEVPPASLEKWKSHFVVFCNGKDSIDILLRYDSTYAEIFEPFVQRIIDSVRIGPYSPQFIDGGLDAAGNLVRLRLPYQYGSVKLTMPANWSWAEAGGGPVPEGEASAEVSTSGEYTLSSLIAKGQGRIGVQKADYNFYTILHDVDKSMLGEANLIFTNAWTMYGRKEYNSGNMAYDASASARESFDRTLVEDLEDCILGNWQEHGHLPFSKDLLHDSYLKTCGEAVYEVHTVKHGGEGNGPTFIFTGLFPTDKAQEMRPVMEGIMNSIRPEL